MANSAPLIELDAGGTAPVLRYDLPEPTSYEGKNFIELDFGGGNLFLPIASEMPSQADSEVIKSVSPTALHAEVAEFVRTGAASRPELRRLLKNAPRLMPPRTVAGRMPGKVALIPPGAEPLPPPPDSETHTANELLTMLVDGEVWVPETGVDGETGVQPIPAPTVPDPHLYLVESIRLSSFLGDYGAGRIVKTFTLLPGERTRISVRTFQRREATRKAASSVLDSLTRESAEDLETSVTREQSDQESYQKTSEYYANAEASARWGWGSAKVSAGIKGSSNAAREESVKNVSNATEKHSSRASAKREVEINTSYEEISTTQEETAIEREIENINLSRTLNFVFRQMNQRFVTLLHLTDVRIGFFNGDRASRREVPLSRIDDLLAEVVRPARRTAVRDMILEQLSAVRGRGGAVVNIVSKTAVAPGDEFLEFDPTLSSQYTDSGGRVFDVKGLLLSADELVMRTEGVIVEAILGNGTALDEYAVQLQELEVRRREALVDLERARAAQLELVNDVIQNGDDSRFDRAQNLACKCGQHQCVDKHTDTETGDAPSAPVLE